MHLTPSWVHVRFTDPYGLFATDSDEHYDSLCDMGSDSDNMWVNKDDVFADDKVQAFKDSNPNIRTHIRVMHSPITSHHSSSPSRSSSASYFTPHIQLMSSNDQSSTRDSPSLGSVAPNKGRVGYIPHSNPIESAAVANDFW